LSKFANTIHQLTDEEYQKNTVFKRFSGRRTIQDK
jgi:hypothetical protein